MSLLVATDLSTRSAAALRYAEELAGRLSTPLTVVHVAPDVRPDIADDAAHALDMFLREYAANPAAVDSSTIVGEVIDTLVEAVVGHRALICGATGSSYLTDIFLGSTASRLIRESPQPVIVVPDGYTPGLSRIVVAMNFDEASRAALHLAEELAEPCDASICLLSAVPEHASDAEAREVADKLESMAARRESLEVSVRVEHGEPAEAIRSAVAELDADLVVMGTHARAEQARFFLGSIAERIVRQPPCPVATVRPFGD